MPTEHAKLSPSSAHQWMACPAAPTAQAPYPDTSSPFAEEGTRAHTLAEMCFNSGRPAADFAKTKIDGVKPDAEMMENVQAYVDWVLSFKDRDDILYTETRLDLSKFITDSFGTADNIIITDDAIHVFDLKYGRGVKVYAENNWQGLCYAGGAYHKHDDDHQIIDIHIHIGQPRLDHFDTWVIDYEELERRLDRIKQAAAATEDPDAPMVPGESQCRWCKASANCPALYELTSDATAELFDDLSEPDSLDSERLSELLRHKKLIEGYLSDIAAEAQRRLESGDTVPGFKLVRANTNRKWGDKAEKALTKALGDAAYERKLIAIGKAEKLLGKDEVDGYTVRPEGAVTIAPEDDKRKAIDEEIEKEFDTL